jgi:hypothetical protein
MVKSESKSMAEGYGKEFPEGRTPSSWLWFSLNSLLALSLLLLWYPALHGGFVFDDEILIVRNPLVHGPLDMEGIFGGRFLGASAGQEAVPFWRPITVLIFWALWHLGHGTALVFHAFSLSVHILGALLAFRFLFRLGLPLTLAGLAAFAFAAHPSQVEGVSWVAAASSPLMTVLLLTFLLAWEQYLARGGWARLIVAYSVFCLALLVREEAVLGLLLAVLLELYHPGGGRLGRGAAKRITLLGGLSLIWFFTRHLALSPVMNGGGEPVPGIWESLLLRLHILGVHIREIVFPGEPNVLRPFPQNLFEDGSGLGESLGWAGSFLGLLAGSLFLSKIRGLPLGRGLLWILFCLSPLLFVGAGTGVTPLADRYHAFAVLGWVFFLADLWRLPWGKWLSPFFLLVFCAIYLPISRGGMEPWKDPRSFWEHASLQNPDSVLAAYSLGRQRLMDFERKGNPRDLEGAAEVLDRALALRQSFGSRGKAEKVQELAIELARAWVQLTRAMQSRRVSSQSVMAAFERILKKSPRNADAWVGLGVSFILGKQVEEAEGAFRKAVELDPANPQAHFNLARLLFSRGARSEARGQLEMVLKIQPQNRGAQDLLRRLKGW